MFATTYTIKSFCGVTPGLQVHVVVDSIATTCSTSLFEIVDYNVEVSQHFRMRFSVRNYALILYFL